MDSQNNNTPCEYCRRSVHPLRGVTCAGCGAPLSSVQPSALWGLPVLRDSIQAQRDFNRTDSYVSYYLEQLEHARNWYKDNIFNA